jgi:hypothetical protein
LKIIGFKIHLNITISTTVLVATASGFYGYKVLVTGATVWLQLAPRIVVACR